MMLKVGVLCRSHSIGSSSAQVGLDRGALLSLTVTADLSTVTTNFALGLLTIGTCITYLVVTLAATILDILKTCVKHRSKA